MLLDRQQQPPVLLQGPVTCEDRAISLCQEGQTLYGPTQRALYRGITQKNDEDHSLRKDAPSLRARLSVFLCSERDADRKTRERRRQTEAVETVGWREGDKDEESESRHDTQRLQERESETPEGSGQGGQHV